MPLLRVSFTQTEVGIMNEIADYLHKQANDLPGDYISNAVKESLLAKAEMLKKILGEGVIENE